MKMLQAVIVMFLVLVSIAAYAAQFYSYPDAASLRDTSRLLVFDNLSGVRNITGAKLRSEVVTQTAVLGAAAAPGTAPLSLQAAATDGPGTPKMVVRNAAGMITMYVTSDGTMVFGPSAALYPSSSVPGNNALSVSVSTVPTVTFNRPVTVTSANMFIRGSAVAPVSDSTGAVWTIPITLAAGTAYILEVDIANIAAANSIVAIDGGIVSGCGNQMATVSSGVCTATFSTAP